uniref:UBC core domain-containing protein n=1 Tax=Macrostomum lignano TaxID=282301 RepID=A0A1I8HHL8_9PLAT
EHKKDKCVVNNNYNKCLVQDRAFKTGDPGFAEFSLAELRLRVRIPTNVSEQPGRFQLYTCMLVKLHDGWESNCDLKELLQRASGRFRIEDSSRGVTSDGAVQSQQRYSGGQRGCERCSKLRRPPRMKEIQHPAESECLTGMRSQARKEQSRANLDGVQPSAATPERL